MPDQPGVYGDVSVDDYIADPVPGGSLSRTGARHLLPPHCPAVYAWERDHPPPSTRSLDMGHAAHTLVLGDGPELVIAAYTDWRKPAAREWRDEMYEQNKVPLLPQEYAIVEGMAAALRDHPLAAKLLAPGSGKPEQTLIWPDKLTGVTLRARLDWLPEWHGTGRLIIPDYKTAKSADPDEWARTAPLYGYDMQAAWYTDGALALGLADEVVVIFIVQEKYEPYLVSVVQLDDMALRIARHRNREAINLYNRCRKANHWPGYYEGEVALVSLPRWYELKYEDLL
jgi:hypothetical protein